MSKPDPSLASGSLRAPEGLPDASLASGSLRAPEGLPEKPLPHPDRDSRPYWEFIRKGELRLQRCDSCGTWRFPPRAICGQCRSFDSTWTATRGLGRVTSWITTHQIFAPAYRSEVPYHVVQVALDEQPDLILPGQLVPGTEPTANLRVRACFRSVTDDVTLLFWEPIEGVE